METQAKIIPYFQNAKIADKVHCKERGEGKISFISKGTPKLISIAFENGGYWVYSEEGKSTDKSEQTLFYYIEL